MTGLAMCFLFFALFVAGFFRPIFSILCYLIIYCVYNPDVWWVIETKALFPRPSLIAMIFIIVASLINSRKLNWTFSRKEIEFYVFLGACWISTLVFGVFLEADNWMYLLKITKIFIFIFFFIRIVNSMADYKLVVFTFIFSALFLSYEAHLASAVGGRVDTIGGLDFGESNGLAAFLSIAVIFLAFQFLNSGWWKKIFYVIGIAFISDAIILTESRSVFIGGALAAVYILFRPPPKKTKQIFFYSILGIIMFISLMDQSFIERMNTITEYAEKSNSFDINENKPVDRLDFWRASIHIFKDHPMGIGVFNFHKIVPQYDPRNPGMDAHNTYVLCYSEIGYLGIIVFFIIIFETIFQIRRISVIARGTNHITEFISYNTAIGAILIIYFSSYMMTHSILYTEILWVLLSMPICLENSIRNSLDNEQSIIAHEIVN